MNPGWNGNKKKKNEISNVVILIAVYYPNNNIADPCTNGVTRMATNACNLRIHILLYLKTLKLIFIRLN